MEAKYNTRSPAVKRLMREALELRDATADYYAQPLSDNLFEWHFTVRGPSDTEFEGGVYHGRIILPTEYPMKPPHIIVLTPNGRFETGKKICLSISGHHPESWQPSWSIRTALVAIIGFMPTPGQGTIGSLDYPKSERIKLAKKSQSFVCKDCCDEGVSVSSLLKQHDPNAPKLSTDVITSDVDPKEIVLYGVKEEKPLTKEEDYVRRRKEASRKMQQKFRDLLMSRTPELVKQVEKSRPPPLASQLPNSTDGGDSPSSGNSANSAGPSSNRSNSNEPATGRRHVDHRFVIEVLLGLIVLVIAIVLCRRSSQVQKIFFRLLGGEGTANSGDEVIAPGEGEGPDF